MFQWLDTPAGRMVARRAVTVLVGLVVGALSVAGLVDVGALCPPGAVAAPSASSSNSPAPPSLVVLRSV